MLFMAPNDIRDLYPRIMSLVLQPKRKRCVGPSGIEVPCPPVKERLFADVEITEVLLPYFMRLLTLVQVYNTTSESNTHLVVACVFPVARNAAVGKCKGDRKFDALKQEKL